MDKHNRNTRKWQRNGKRERESKIEGEGDDNKTKN